MMEVFSIMVHVNFGIERDDPLDTSVIEWSGNKQPSPGRGVLCTPQRTRRLFLTFCKTSTLLFIKDLIFNFYM
jgi:hypothetical protein